jgi:CMP-N-acetylneuraminic acid synthetase
MNKTFKDKDVFFLIPARAGSKGIPRKNLQRIKNRTLIEIAIEQALKVGNPENIYVSSDSLDILKYAEGLKVKTLLRSPRESSDTADANMVVSHFIDSNSLSNFPKTTIVYLQPTSPFRNSDLIVNCINSYQENTIPVVTVRKVNDHPAKMITLLKGKINNYISDSNPTGNRQELLELLIPSGSVYVFSIEDFFNNNGQIPIIGAIPVEVFGAMGIDIDNEYDLLLAQTLGENFEL